MNERGLTATKVLKCKQKKFQKRILCVYKHLSTDERFLSRVE